ncbi:MAG: hypothetical protein IJL26_12630 [Clostridia bacterium]|nr:hypothetical protein [Clostridia bacterium]
MEHAYSILMFIFAGALFLYGLLMFATKDINLIPYRRRYAAKMSDKKLYVRQLGKIVMLTALSPAISAAVGLLPLGETVWPEAVALLGSMVLFLWIGTKMIRIAQ